VLFFRGERAPRRIAVPFAVCEEHAARIDRALASPARRRFLERALGSPPLPALDWQRSRVEFIDGARIAGPSITYSE
jgi:hypothetical protein